MNISYNWLKDYIDFDLTPQELSAALTSLGLETEGVEEIEAVKGGLEGLVIGEVLTCIDHPNSDHLHITTVDLGDGEPLQIVCGAPNVATGQKVVVATIGTTLYSGDESFKIKKSKVRGEESNGMICSAVEIGVGESSDGIIELPKDAKAGTLAKDYYNIRSEYVLEVDITPNRVDAASHFGVARDLAAHLKQNGKPCGLKRPSVDGFKIGNATGGITVDVQNTEACPRYAGVTIKGVSVKESPEWLKNRLTYIGLRPINNIVDITNYVLHEQGHPLHAFDAKYITSGKVSIKTLAEGTKFTTLDSQELTLSDRDLMICDNDNGLCIGGVFGGLNSGVTEATTDIFLECAYFHPKWVRKTARRHTLSTDSSFRFERGCDPNDTLYVLKRAALLIQELAGGTITGDVQDVYPMPIARPTVELSYARVNRLIGKEISKETVKSILASLEIEITKEDGDMLMLAIPTYRADVLRDVDVIEDILRVYGYNNVEIGDSVKSNLSYQKASDKGYNLQNIISEQLTGAGFNEILNNSLTKEAYYKESEMYPATSCVYLMNPLSSDLNVMRQTLLYGGLESIAYNQNRRNADIKFYEFGNCYYYDASKKAEGKNLNEYSEDFKLGIWLTGNMVGNNWAQAQQEATVYDLKAYVENIFFRLGVPAERVEYTQVANELYSAALQVIPRGAATAPIAELGIVSKKILKKLDIDTPVYFAELSWNKLMKLTSKHTVTFGEISKYPSVRRDLALLLDKSVRFEEIERIAYKADKKLLKKVSLFDVYEGKNLPEGKKSYAVNFVIRDEEKTLTDKQIDAIMQKMQMSLEKELGAQLR